MLLAYVWRLSGRERKVQKTPLHKMWNVRIWNISVLGEVMVTVAVQYLLLQVLHNSGM
jgi:hypothetical protein